MRIEKKNGLLVASMKITFRGQSKVITDLALDTGAVHSIVSLDEVEELGIAGEIGDEIVYMHGIGGTEQSLRKRVDRIEFANFTCECAFLDFWDFSSHGDIRGLIGLDILEAGKFVIDLKELEIFQAGAHA